MTMTKKWIAIALSALMLLGLLAGCGQTAEQPPETTDPVQAGSTPVGVVLVSMGAEFQISYDAEGFVIGISGNNDAGRTVAAAYTDFLGRDCVIAVRALLDLAVAESYTGNARNLVIRVGMESEIPSEGFLENIGQDVQYKCDELGSGMMVKLITDTELTPEGFINVATAKELAAARAGLQDVAALEGASEPENGVYTFTFGEEGEADTATVDANYGTVTLASEVDADDSGNADDATEPHDPDAGTEEEILEQETEAAGTPETEAVEEEVEDEEVSG